MKQGFLSIALVLVMALVLAKDFEIYGALYSGTQAVKNDIVLGQRIKETTYSLENGFRLTVHEALKSIPTGAAFRILPPRERETIERTAGFIVCDKVKEWFSDYNYSLYIGYIDSNDYSEKSLPGECIAYLYVNLDKGTAEIKDKQNIKMSVSYRLAFRFSGDIDKHSFIVLVPEGTVIE
jgi:hypothetical protein